MFLPLFEGHFQGEYSIHALQPRSGQILHWLSSHGPNSLQLAAIVQENNDIDVLCYLKKPDSVIVT